MGKKAGGTGGGWLATVRKVLKPASSNKDPRHAKKQKGGSDVEEAAEVVSVEHFPTAETSPEVTNELGAAVWLGRREEDGYAEVGGARRERRHRRMRGREERAAAVRIQAFYRGYLARRALRALRGLVRLQALVRGHQVRRQVQRTMLSMQALVRAQDRVRARRLVTSSPYAAAPLRHPSQLLPPVARHNGGGRRSSFGFGDDAEVEGQQAPPRHSNASRFLQETWDQCPTYEYGSQHRRQEERRRDECNSKAGWRWMEACVQPPEQHAPDHQTNQLLSRRRSPTRDLYPVRPDPASILPGYMAATQSARAKARSMAPPPAARGARAGSAAAASSGWSHYGGAGQRATTNSPPESLGGGLCLS